jgi:hypothetical protein
MIDIMQTTESSRMDRNALRSSFSIINSIPFVARNIGEITAVVKRISAAIFSFPAAIKIRAEATKIDNVISNPRLIRPIIDFIAIGLGFQV